jgi:hypothetical protein
MAQERKQQWGSSTGAGKAEFCQRLVPGYLAEQQWHPSKEDCSLLTIAKQTPPERAGLKTCPFFIAPPACFFACFYL